MGIETWTVAEITLGGVEEEEDGLGKASQHPRTTRRTQVTEKAGKQGEKGR